MAANAPARWECEATSERKADLAQLNICFLAGTLGQGGAERQLFYILKTLYERKARVRLLSLTSGEFWEKRLCDAGVPVEWVGKSQSRLARLKNIIAVLRRERPDIVQSQHFYVNPYAAAAARWTGLKSIGAIRSDMLNEVHLENETISKWGLKHCGVVAANSKPALERALEFGLPRNKLTLLPNVVDTDEFQPDPRPVNGAFTILGVGRLVPSKRYDRLLAVTARLKQICLAPVKLVLAGDGPARKDLEQQAKALRLMPTVEFLGQRTDLPAVYNSASVLAITSDYEGTPNVALEAMACGLPVISTNVGGMSDLIEDGVNGYLARRQDEEKLADRMKTIAEDPALLKRMGANARAYVVGNYSLKRLPHYLEDLYGNVLSA